MFPSAPFRNKEIRKVSTPDEIFSSIMVCHVISSQALCEQMLSLYLLQSKLNWYHYYFYRHLLYLCCIIWCIFFFDGREEASSYLVYNNHLVRRTIRIQIYICYYYFWLLVFNNYLLRRTIRIQIYIVYYYFWLSSWNLGNRYH